MRYYARGTEFRKMSNKRNHARLFLNAVFVPLCLCACDTTPTKEHSNTKVEIASAESNRSGDARGTFLHMQEHRPEVVKFETSTLRPPSTKPLSNQNDYVDLALNYVSENRTRYGVEEVFDLLEVASIKESLLGVHVMLQEIIENVPVSDSAITISIDKKTGEIYRAYNTVIQHGQLVSSKTAITEDEAYDLAWKHLKVHGELLSDPSITKLYVTSPNDSSALMLVYRIVLHVAQPAGEWQVDVDATSGDIVKVQDIRVSKTLSETKNFLSYNGPLLDRREAFRAFERAWIVYAEKDESRVDGTALVFDPDPMTALNDTSLTDSSPDADFEDAYRSVTLREITKRGSEYSLEGPWVRIVDIESPSSAPSTTADGNWTAGRGDNAFNDVMTYYHIDKSQRYLQSLGFVEETGIQYGAIKADSDGLSGSDNSHYIRSSNSLAFGHGCIDDNEDADVILHEYGHAIAFSINPNFNGGDSGAIGEGFSDYWAASANAESFDESFDNAKVFSWDAADGCWAGRRLDKTDLQYDPATIYTAHESIVGGVSDELWSTPLFQAMIALMDRNVPKKEIDRIILEAQFGFSSGMSMRDMAAAIVETAALLYPRGYHAHDFSVEFVNHNILEDVIEPPAIANEPEIVIEPVDPEFHKLEPGFYLLLL